MADMQPAITYEYLTAELTERVRGLDMQLRQSRQALKAIQDHPEFVPLIAWLLGRESRGPSL